MFIGFPVYMVLWYQKIPLLGVCDKPVKKDWLTWLDLCLWNSNWVCNCLINICPSSEGGQRRKTWREVKWFMTFPVFNISPAIQLWTCKTVLSILNRFWNSTKVWKFLKSFHTRILGIAEWLIWELHDIYLGIEW